MRNFVIILLLTTLNLQVYCNSSEDDDSAVESVENDNIFKPTHEWQKIGKDQSIPRGLHVRLNLQTGEREAKLIDDNDEDKHTEITQVTKNEEISRDKLQEALKNVPGDEGITSEDIERVKKNFRSYETIKEELKELELNVQTDLELMNELFTKFKSDDQGERLIALTDLEYLVHQFDNAREFVRSGGLTDVVLESLNSSSPLIRAEAIRLLGSAAQSNTAVQIAALESGCISALLRVLALDKDPTVRARAVYAISCLVRRFPTALLKLVTDGGLEVKETEEICQRTPEDSPLHTELLEKRRQYGLVKLLYHLVDGGWCERLPKLLQASPKARVERRDDLSSAITQERPVRPEHDVVEKVVTAMLALVDDCKHRFQDARLVLLDLEKWYQELASREEIDRKSRNTSEEHYYYYTGLAKQVASLSSRLNSKKDEL
ncbi:Nucleotide exchange factor SIL1 [Blattella germanica]|nr:Nucleotide exchange factor SIL1 [Blattella germanica]